MDPLVIVLVMHLKGHRLTSTANSAEYSIFGQAVASLVMSQLLKNRSRRVVRVLGPCRGHDHSSGVVGYVTIVDVLTVLFTGVFEYSDDSCFRPMGFGALRPPK